MSNDESFIFGVQPVHEAISAGKSLDKIWIAEGHHQGALGDLIKELAMNKMRWKTVPVQKLNTLARGKNHQGVIASSAAIELTSLNDMIQAAYDKGQDPLIIMLDGVSDVRNFGAIVRTALCMGASGAIISAVGGAPIGADAAKTSAGALFNLPIHKTDSAFKAIKSCQVNGLQVIGLTEKGSSSLWQTPISGPTLIVMGDEEKGLSTEVWKLCDKHVNIPMSTEGISSLNVSVAAGIILAEIARQRL